MPIYQYKCPCGNLFSEFVSYTRVHRVISSCCKLISRKTSLLFRNRIKIGRFISSQDRYQIDEANKHGDINGGIPFGQAPGDEDYTDSRGLKPGDTDYLGPTP